MTRTNGEGTQGGGWHKEGAGWHKGIKKGGWSFTIHEEAVIALGFSVSIIDSGLQKRVHESHLLMILFKHVYRSKASLPELKLRFAMTIVIAHIFYVSTSF